MRAYQHAQLSPVTTQKGDIDRLVNGDEWWVPPNVELRKDRLYWDCPSDDDWKWVGAKKGMLESFCTLADAPDCRILEFARRYGILDVQRKSIPWTTRRLFPMLGRVNVDESRGWQPLGLWRRLSGEAFALLKASSELIEGKCVGLDPCIGEIAGTLTEPLGFLHAEAMKLIVAHAVNVWLATADAQPVVIWGGSEKPSIRLGGGGVFSALAIQLALAIGRSKGFAVCYHCRNEYPPEQRRPKTGQRNFCPVCRAAAIPSLYSGREYEARKRERRKAGQEQKV